MSNSNFLRNIPPVTRHLLIVNVALWLVAIVFYNFRHIDLNEMLGLHYFTNKDFNPAQFFTYMFLHDTSGIAHIFFNMFSLYIFGKILEQVMGSRRFLFYYLATGVGAALIQSAVIYFQITSLESQMSAAAINEVMVNGAAIIDQGMNYKDPFLGELNMLYNGYSVGASGAVFGILLAFGMFFPDAPLYLFFIPVPIKAKYMVIGYGLLELIFGVSGTLPGIGHFAHVGGLIVGLIIILIWKKKGTIRGGYY